MSDFTKKVRAMLDAASTQGDWIHNGDGTIWHTGGPGGQISHAFFDLHDADVAAESPNLLREACERIEKLENIVDIADDMAAEVGEYVQPPVVEEACQKFYAALSDLDAKEQS